MHLGATYPLSFLDAPFDGLLRSGLDDSPRLFLRKNAILFGTSIMTSRTLYWYDVMRVCLFAGTGTRTHKMYPSLCIRTARDLY